MSVDRKTYNDKKCKEHFRGYAKKKLFCLKISFIALFRSIMAPILKHRYFANCWHFFNSLLLNNFVHILLVAEKTCTEIH